MAIDVLTYNALQEVNQELKRELGDLTDQITEASGGGGGAATAGPPIALQCESLRKIGEAAYMLNANQWCMIPTTMGACPVCPNAGTAFTNGLSLIHI